MKDILVLTWAAFALMSVQPVHAMCLGDLLSFYIKHPQGMLTQGAVLAGSELALVRVIAVKTDRSPIAPWRETGTLELRTLEEHKAKRLPSTFTVRYYKRVPLVDCETWDFVSPKAGMKLVAFIRPANKGWGVPEIPAMGIVVDIDHVFPKERANIQTMFRTRL